MGGGRGQFSFASNRLSLPRIFITDHDGGEWQQIMDMPEGACQPSWSPDGRYLLYISPCDGNQEEYPGSAIFLIEIDVNNTPIPLPKIPGGDYDPAWSPDGSEIAFVSAEKGLKEIWVMDSDGVVLVQVTHSPSFEFDPAWRPPPTELTQ